VFSGDSQIEQIVQKLRRLGIWQNVDGFKDEKGVTSIQMSDSLDYTLYLQFNDRAVKSSDLSLMNFSNEIQSSKWSLTVSGLGISPSNVERLEKQWFETCQALEMENPKLVWLDSLQVALVPGAEKIEWSRKGIVDAIEHSAAFDANTFWYGEADADESIQWTISESSKQNLIELQRRCNQRETIERMNANVGNTPIVTVTLKLGLAQERLKAQWIGARHSNFAKARCQLLESSRLYPMLDPRNHIDTTLYSIDFDR
jgi:hypothetical protein